MRLMKMKKVVIIVGAAFVFIIFLTSLSLFTSKDSWECVNGEWVKKGNPSNPAPVGGCGSQVNVDYNIPTTFDDSSSFYPNQPTTTLPDTLTVSQDENFPIVLDLDNNPGYSWQPEYDSAYLQIIENKEVTDPNSGNPSGAGQQVIIFKPIKKGSTTLNIKYAEEGAGSYAPLKTKTYKVSIN